MLGFKKFYNARRVLIGIELMEELNKGQYSVPAQYGNSFTRIWADVLAT